MTKNGSFIPLATTASKIPMLKLKKLSGLFVLILCAGSAVFAVESLDDQYFRIYGIVNDADALNASGRTDAALAKYRQAQNALVNLKKANPTWNASVVSFRLNYLNDKINGITQPAVVAPAPLAAAKPDAKGPAKSATNSDHLKLISPGAEPRQVLRFHIAPDSSQTTAMTIKMGITMQMGETPGQPINLPPMMLTVQGTAKDVSADGEVTFESVVQDAKVADESGAAAPVAAAMKGAMSGLKGLTATGTMSNRGFNKNVEVKIPAEADPQMRQSAEQMKEAIASIDTPLPEEAVGVGAKWEVRKPVKSQGMTLNQIATYQLVSADTDTVTISSTLSQSAANQKVQNPAMPGIKVDLTKMTGTSTGNVVLNLTHVMPQKVTSTTHTDMAMGMNAGAQKQSMNMKMDMDIQMETK